MSTSETNALVDALAQVSLVSANFGNGEVYREIQEEWFSFIGGKPAEVVVYDGGSNAATQQVYWELFQQGRIDKLQIIRPEHPENDKERCYRQEYHVARMASRPYILLYKIDTLPFRRGNDNWLPEAIAYLDRPEVFAVSGSFNYNTKHHEAWPGWYYSRMCTENFAIMKQETFVRAMDEFASEFIRARFHGRSPASTNEFPHLGRFLVERGFTWYMEKHNLFTLVKDDGPDWTILHTNLQGNQLISARDRLNRRDGVDSHLRWRSRMPCPYAVYFGQPRWTILKRHAHMALGATPIGSVVRKIRSLMRPQLGYVNDSSISRT